MRPFTATMSTAVLAVAVALAVPATVPAAVSAAPSANHVTGTLPDGATWIADVPAQWNGTLLLYSHGFGPLTAADAPDPGVLALGHRVSTGRWDSLADPGNLNRVASGLGLGSARFVSYHPSALTGAVRWPWPLR